jgi:hypothetical protein
MQILDYMKIWRILKCSSLSQPLYWTPRYICFDMAPRCQKWVLWLFVQFVLWSCYQPFVHPLCHWTEHVTTGLDRFKVVIIIRALSCFVEDVLHAFVASDLLVFSYCDFVNGSLVNWVTKRYVMTNLNCAAIFNEITAMFFLNNDFHMAKAWQSVNGCRAVGAAKSSSTPNQISLKVNVKLFLRLTKHLAMKTYWGVAVVFHAFLTSA